MRRGNATSPYAKPRSHFGSALNPSFEDREAERREALSAQLELKKQLKELRRQEEQQAIIYERELHERIATKDSRVKRSAEMKKEKGEAAAARLEFLKAVRSRDQEEEKENQRHRSAALNSTSKHTQDTAKLTRAWQQQERREAAHERLEFMRHMKEGEAKEDRAFAESQRRALESASARTDEERREDRRVRKEQRAARAADASFSRALKVQADQEVLLEEQRLAAATAVARRQAAERRDTREREKKAAIDDRRAAIQEERRRKREEKEMAAQEQAAEFKRRQELYREKRAKQEREKKEAIALRHQASFRARQRKQEKDAEVAQERREMQEAYEAAMEERRRENEAIAERRERRRRERAAQRQGLKPSTE